MALIEDIKVVMRITIDDFDTELQDLVDDAVTDLIAAGVVKAFMDAWLIAPDSDKRIKRTVIVYVKSQFGWNNPDADKFKVVYEDRKCAITQSNEYAYFEVTINSSKQQLIQFDEAAKESNDAGTAVFYSRIANHVPYVVNGALDYVDITGTTVINAG